MRRVNGLIALILVVLAAFALRVFRLDVQSLWYDEAFSVYLAHFDLATITARTAADIQPPLYYILLHFWIALAGDGEFALRFLSLGFGVLTVPLIWVAMRRLFNRDAALIAAILATLSPLYVWYAQEARMYTLITCLLLLSSYALWRALDQPTARHWWIVLALANIAAVYTHYFAFAVLAFQIAFCVLRFQRANFFRVIISFAAILIAFLPWLPFVIARFGQDASYWQGALKLDEAVRHIFINFTTGESVLESIGQDIAVGWLVVLLIGLAFLAIRHSPFARQKSAIAFLILYLVIPLALLLVLFYRNPKFNARYLMIASPALFMLLGAGLGNFSRVANRVSRLGFYVLPWAFLLVASCYADANAYFDPAFTKADFRGVARYIEAHAAPDEAILLVSGHMFPAFDYYYHGAVPTIRLPDDPTLNTEHVLGYETANVLNQTLAGKRGVWVVEWQNEVVDPNGFVPMLLDSQGVEQPHEGIYFWQVGLRHWTLPVNAHFSPQPIPAVTRAANFGGKIQLLGFTPVPIPANGGVAFDLDYQVLAPLAEDYQVALRVTDAAGNFWGKLDRRPAGYNYPAPRWKPGEYLFGTYTVPLLVGAPAGDYFVELVFYSARNPSGLDVLAPNGAPMGKSVKLGPLPALRASYLVDSTKLDIQNEIDRDVGPFRLYGYNLGRQQASAGETIPLSLFWFNSEILNQNYTFQIQFGDVLSKAFPLANAQFPTTQWRMGETVRGQYLIPIPPNVPPGATQLRLVLSDGNAINLAPFTIEKTDRVFVQPNIAYAQSAAFGNTIALVGYNLSATTLKPGAPLQVTLVWQARGASAKPYTVFVHLLGGDGKPVAQQDAQPLNGARPTNGWVANEFIVDPYTLTIPTTVTPGNYQIEIGWYDAQDFSRLSVLDPNGVPTSDHIILPSRVDISP